MKSTCFKIIIILMLVILISGCYRKAIRQEEAKNRHTLIIVPFKAPPVAIMSWGAGTVILAGVAGAAVVDGATKEGREKTVDTLNRTSGQWEPSGVLAQECLDLIKKGTTFQIENISMVESRIMPGLESLQTKDSKVFTAESQIYGFGSPWMQAGGRMLRGSKSHIQYKQEYPQSNADWALEVFSTYIHMRKLQKIEFNVGLKLVDTSSGEKIAFKDTYDTFAISLSKDISNFKLFEDEFRSAARQICSRVLSKMGLISIR